MISKRLFLHSTLLCVGHKGGLLSTKFCWIKSRLHSGIFSGGTKVPSHPLLRPIYRLCCQESHCGPGDCVNAVPQPWDYVWAIQGTDKERIRNRGIPREMGQGQKWFSLPSQQHQKLDKPTYARNLWVFADASSPHPCNALITLLCPILFCPWVLSPWSL